MKSIDDWPRQNLETMKDLPPLPAKGQSVKHPNLERNIMIVAFISALIVLWAIFFVWIPSLEENHKQYRQEQFNKEARQLRDKVIEQARKENP